MQSKLISSSLVLLVLIYVFALDARSTSSKRFSYDGYSLIRSRPLTADQLDFLQKLLKEEVGLSQRSLETHQNVRTLTPYNYFIMQTHLGIQFWTQPSSLNNTVDILVSPSLKVTFLDQLDERNIEAEEIIANVGTLARESYSSASHQSVNSVDQLEHSDIRIADLQDSIRFYSKFQRYSSIESKLRDLEQLDPRVKVETIGYSTEKRKLHLVKISNDPSANKPVILIDAGHHAREVSYLTE